MCLRVKEEDMQMVWSRDSVQGLKSRIKSVCIPLCQIISGPSPKGIIRELERRDEKEHLNKLGLQNIFTMGKEKHLET